MYIYIYILVCICIYIHMTHICICIYTYILNVVLVMIFDHDCTLRWNPITVCKTPWSSTCYVNGVLTCSPCLAGGGVQVLPLKLRLVWSSDGSILLIRRRRQAEPLKHFLVAPQCLIEPDMILICIVICIHPPR